MLIFPSLLLCSLREFRTIKKQISLSCNLNRCQSLYRSQQSLQHYQLQVKSSQASTALLMMTTMNIITSVKTSIPHCTQQDCTQHWQERTHMNSSPLHPQHQAPSHPSPVQLFTQDKAPSLKLRPNHHPPPPHRTLQLL